MTSGRVHGSGVLADQRLCLAASAAGVRHVARHRALLSRYGPRPACGVGCTGRCWTNSGPRARWSGARRSSTRPPFAPKCESVTGLNPVDRGKKCSKLHVPSDAQGIPLAVAVSGANMHDSLALRPLIRGLPAVRSRRGPRRRRPVKLLADKAYSPPNTWPGCASAGSSRASSGPASSPANVSVGTLEDRTVDRLALRLPPPHRPVRTKGRALPRLPRPGRRPDLLQEARET